MFWFLYDTNGRIQEAQKVNVTGWTNLNGYAGATSFDETDTRAQDAFMNKAFYTVVNGALVKTVTDAQLLASAQSTQTALIESAYAKTMAAGFTSSADGTSRTYGWEQPDALHLDLVQSAIDHGIETFPIAYADINGNPVSIASQAVLTQLDKDASTFAWGNTTNRRQLLANIKAATTVSAVQAVTW